MSVKKQDTSWEKEIEGGEELFDSVEATGMVGYPAINKMLRVLTNTKRVIMICNNLENTTMIIWEVAAFLCG